VDVGDLDSVTIGAAVADVSGLFDRHWNSPVVYAIGELTTARPDAEVSAKALASWQAIERAQRGLASVQALCESALAGWLRTGRIPFTAAHVRVLADDAAKVERPDEDPSKNLRPQLMPEIAGLREQLLLISPSRIAQYALGRDADRVGRRRGWPRSPPCVGAHEQCMAAFQALVLLAAADRGAAVTAAGSAHVPVSVPVERYRISSTPSHLALATAWCPSSRT
jgi:phosphatidylserine/phosphatidylglycerophosphate/cardiolipin synthase-like enzyme